MNLNRKKAIWKTNRFSTYNSCQKFGPIQTGLESLLIKSGPKEAFLNFSESYMDYYQIGLKGMECESFRLWKNFQNIASWDRRIKSLVIAVQPFAGRKPIRSQFFEKNWAFTEIFNPPNQLDPKKRILGNS